MIAVGGAKFDALIQKNGSHSVTDDQWDC
jgi:hypothetical protein